MWIKRWLLAFVMVSSMLVLVSCGGGGEGNTLPTADAGADQSVVEQDTVTLDGTASNDPNGSITQYQWTQTSGINVTLNGADTATPSFTAPTVNGPETLVFQLIVTDNDGADSNPDSVTVTVVENQVPIANAGNDQTVIEADTVNLDGTGSSDSDGTITQYQWTQTSGTNVTLTGADTATPSFTAPAVAVQENLVFELIVTDNKGAASSADSVTITVNPNTPPVANAGQDQEANKDDTVNLDGTGSSDADGTIVQYQWTQTSGTNVTLTGADTATPSFTAPDVANQEDLVFQLIVTDNKGDPSAPDSVTITINASPTANAGPDQPNVVETDTVNLDGTGSSDPDGTIAQYQWTQTSGTNVTLTGADTATPSFTAPSVAAPETLVFQLVVTDNKGADSTPDTVSITVNPNQPPTANAGPDQAVDENSTVNLDGTGSSDPEGRTLQYQWTQTSGTTVTLTGADTATPSFTAPAASAVDLVFQLEVTDDKGATSTDTVTIDVTFRADDFSGGFTNWTVVDDSGKVSDWQIAAGELGQNNGGDNSVKLLATDTIYHLGSYVWDSSAGSTARTDYSFSVDVTPMQTVTPWRQDDIGVMFRYTDNDNYYRFSMNARHGFSRLEKKVAGTFTTLAADTRGYVAGQTLHISVIVEGSAIVLSVNGEAIFAVTDSDLATGSVALYTEDLAKFDNVIVDALDTAPQIALATPLAHSVITGGTINAVALARNVPAGGSVEFLLDGGNSQVDTTAPFTAVFNGVATGNHTVEAILRDATNTELSRDTNVDVGVGGDIYVGVGDSLLLGERDTYGADNTSTTGRVLGIEGISATLSDLLDSTTSKPNVVKNAGIPGDRAIDGLNRLPSILESHSGANRSIVFLGTNDSNTFNPTPSGQGLNPGDAGYDGSFKDSMQRIIDALITAGSSNPYVTVIPPAWRENSGSNLANSNPCTNARTTNIIEYNQVIQTELNNIVVGPDLFSAFLDCSDPNNPANNLISMVYDSFLHFNALGYKYMAHLWHNTINSGSPVPLPFILTGLVPSEFRPWVKQNLLEVGDACYVAGSFDAPQDGLPYESITLASIPASMANGVWIMTAQGDWNRTSDIGSYIEFNVDRAVTVYVAYDSGATSLPDWLNGNGWASTGDTLTTTGDPNTATFDVYSKAFPAGLVELGGNLAPGAAGADSNYLISVVPQ